MSTPLATLTFNRVLQRQRFACMVARQDAKNATGDEFREAIERHQMEIERLTKRLVLNKRWGTHE